MKATIHVGEALGVLQRLPSASVHACITSPPYWGLRDYGTASWDGGDSECEHMVGGQVQDSKAPGAITTGQRPGVDASKCRDCGALRVDQQLGIERTPQEYAERLVEVFREVRRVLRDDGTVWIVIGDSHFGSWGNYGGQNRGNGTQREIANGSQATNHAYDGLEGFRPPTAGKVSGLKPKDLAGIPWRVAFALQADGWWLRSDIVWSKVNCMPESVEDRPTRSHEYIFLLTKNERYFYDHEAIKEPLSEGSILRLDQTSFATQTGGPKDYANGDGNANRSARRSLANLHARSVDDDGEMRPDAGRNKRTVWTTTLQPFPAELCTACHAYYGDGVDTEKPCPHCGATAWMSHFAVYPPDLIAPAILAGTSERGCCAICGAPWRRVTEASTQPNAYDAGGGAKAEASEAARLAGGIGRMDGGRRAVDGSTFNNNPRRRPLGPQTVGWTPACQCGAVAKETVPCVVLDPFCGSGTTGVVALRHHRDFVGIELNPNYAQMAAARIRDDQPMFNEVSVEPSAFPTEKIAIHNPTDDMVTSIQTTPDADVRG